MLLVASETGHVYTFATRKLQPMITSEAGKALIQTCLNSPDPCPSGSGGDQRMSATGFEETELSYNIGDEEQKVRQLVYQNPPSHAQHFQQHHSPHHQHHMMIPPHPHSQIPCSSPGPMLGSGYSQQCPSPYPSSHPHMHQSSLYSVQLNKLLYLSTFIQAINLLFHPISCIYFFKTTPFINSQERPSHALQAKPLQIVYKRYVRIQQFGIYT